MIATEKALSTPRCNHLLAAGSRQERQQKSGVVRARCFELMC